MTKIPYLKPEFKRIFFLEWQLFENTQGCTPVQFDGFGLQMDKSPPPLLQAASKSTPPPVVAAPAVPKAKESTKPALVGFLEWMTKPEAEATAQSTKPTRKLPKPFDLYDIPAALKTAGFPVAAKLSQKWLDAPAYSAYGTDEPGSAKEQTYPKDKVDTTSVSLDWLRDLPKIEERYQALLGKLNSEPARKALRDNFTNHLATHSNTSHELSTRKHCQGDWQTVHALFQFQLEAVSMLDTMTDTMGMTDVTAALANFNFYAAVARADITSKIYNVYNTPTGTQRCSKSTVQVTHIWVYAKDSYSFHDSGQSSQYLGHWNKHGVIVLPAAVAASVGMKKIADATHIARQTDRSKKLLNWLNSQQLELWETEVGRYPMDISGNLAEKDVYYPVRNRNYRNWRQVKGRGGDFLIMTEPKLLKLNQPIVLDMAEVCR
jgi:hypothetical protein